MDYGHKINSWGSGSGTQIRHGSKLLDPANEAFLWNPAPTLPETARHYAQNLDEQTAPALFSRLVHLSRSQEVVRPGLMGRLIAKRRLCWIRRGSAEEATGKLAAAQDF